MSSADLGLLMWIAMFALSIWARRAHRRRVSRNARAPHAGTGKKWEQVAPMDECFDDLED